MQFSIITPSYRSSPWLRLCVASVADQQDVEAEHIVQDACSDDGTQNWLPKDPRVKAFIEKDRGMYDAINRGFRRAGGDILGYLNCDEQYLPGALQAVQNCFAADPQVQAVLSDTIVTDSEGNYRCHRFSLLPGPYQMWVRFPVLSCAFFVRRQIVQEMGIYFDDQWKALGDWFWIAEMVKRGVRMALLPRFTSAFADTGANLGLSSTCVREQQIKWKMAPLWVRLAKFLFIVDYRVRLAVRGANWQKPFDYALYTLASPDQRVVRHAAKPTSFWKRPGR